MLAFETAVQVHGAHMIETDVHLTADGEVAVFHDHTLAERPMVPERSLTTPGQSYAG